MLSGSAAGFAELGGKMFGLEVELPDQANDILSDNKTIDGGIDGATAVHDKKASMGGGEFFRFLTRALRIGKRL